MKPKGRYTSREQIVEQIDKWVARAAAHQVRAYRLFQSAGEMREESRKKKTEGAKQRLLFGAKNADEVGEKNLERSGKIRGGILKRLSAKLAEFDTETLPGMTDDKSVEAL